MIFSGPTISDQIVLYNNRSTGFDYLRIMLAFAVVIWHSYFLATAMRATTTSFHDLVRIILPMFFALSGFLISGSLLRTKSIVEFITLRMVRIIPALAVETLLSAFIIGALLTVVPLSEYFTDHEFFTYLRNVYGDVHFKLPGLFEANPTTLVNVSMWTIPYELECYLAVVVLWAVGAVRGKNILLLTVVVAAQFALPVRDLINHDVIRQYANNLPGRMLVLSFLYGVVLYFFRDKIVLRLWMAIAAGALCWLLMQWSSTSYFVALPAAYLTVYLGLTNPPKIPVLMDGDYSYGVYLYAAPIQQSIIALFPHHRDFWFVLGVSIVPIIGFAAFSWHAVEKPAHRRRRRAVELAGMGVEMVTMVCRWRPLRA